MIANTVRVLKAAARSCTFIKSYHVSEFPNAAKNKIPDPMTKAAFFTESHRPPVLSCTQAHTHNNNTYGCYNTAFVIVPQTNTMMKMISKTINGNI